MFGSFAVAEKVQERRVSKQCQKENTESRHIFGGRKSEQNRPGLFHLKEFYRIPGNGTQSASGMV